VARGDRLPAAPAALVRAIATSYNHDNQEGDGLSTGLAEVAPKAWGMAGVGPDEVDLACVYDDYPVMALVQLADLGIIHDGDPKRFLQTRLEQARWPLNTSGGQLSAGQAGAGGGLHGLVEAATQLRGRAGERQVDVRIAVVSGYGMVLLRYGACANVVILERA
jgi:acetyl-CoA acetyltransferase